MIPHSLWFETVRGPAFRNACTATAVCLFFLCTAELRAKCCSGGRSEQLPHGFSFDVTILELCSFLEALVGILELAKPLTIPELEALFGRGGRVTLVLLRAISG
jgi:hypothetical protein